MHLHSVLGCAVSQLGALGKYVGTLQFIGVTVALSEGYWENPVRGLKESTCWGSDSPTIDLFD